LSQSWIKYFITAVLLMAAVIGGFLGYRYLKNERQELEQAKAESAALQKTPMSRIKAELAKNKWTAGAIKLEFDDGTGRLTIIDDTNPGGGLDQPIGSGSSVSPEQVLQQTYNLYIRAGLAVFGSVEEVKSLTVIRKIPLNRGTGIVALTEVANIKTNKDKFLSTDWKSLEEKPIYKEVEASAEKLKLDTGFARSIKNANVLILLPDF
jgi:hypothetical protein